MRFLQVLYQIQTFQYLNKKVATLLDGLIPKHRQLSCKIFRGIPFPSCRISACVCWRGSRCTLHCRRFREIYIDFSDRKWPNTWGFLGRTQGEKSIKGCEILKYRTWKRSDSGHFSRCISQKTKNGNDGDALNFLNWTQEPAVKGIQKDEAEAVFFPYSRWMVNKRKGKYFRIFTYQGNLQALWRLRCLLLKIYPTLPNCGKIESYRAKPNFRRVLERKIAASAIAAASKGGSQEEPSGKKNSNGRLDLEGAAQSHPINIGLVCSRTAAQ